MIDHRQLLAKQTLCIKCIWRFFLRGRFFRIDESGGIAFKIDILKIAATPKGTPRDLVHRFGNVNRFQFFTLLQYKM